MSKPKWRKLIHTYRGQPTWRAAHAGCRLEVGGGPLSGVFTWRVERRAPGHTEPDTPVANGTRPTLKLAKREAAYAAVNAKCAMECAALGVAT